MLILQASRDRLLATLSSLTLLGGLVLASAAFTCPGSEPSSPEGGSGGTGGIGAAGGSGGIPSTGGEGGTGGNGANGGSGGSGGCAANLDDDPMNCGACGRACAAIDTAIVSCQLGVCDSTCQLGRLNLKQPAAPAADDGCEAKEHRVFVTSSSFPSNLGGAVGADAICTTTAADVGLGGIWAAWLSDSTTSPLMRFKIDGGPYKLLNEARIANDFADLTDAMLALPIGLTEIMSPGNKFSVWTGTAPGGAASVMGDFCLDWTAAGTAGSTTYGFTLDVANGWTETQTVPCDVSFHLYCFEQ